MSDSLVKRLEQKIEALSIDTEYNEIGKVVSISDGIATISGLFNCKSMELLSFSNGLRGIALNLEVDSVGAVILGDYKSISEGDEVKRTNQVLSVPVSDEILGRVVNPLAEAIDGKSDLTKGEPQLLEKVSPGVIERESVSVPLQTGIKVIDALVPIGRGQRQLILGDRQTGKTTIAVDTIINQKGKGVKCVYVAVGQKQSKVMQLVQLLEKAGAMEYTTVVLAGASDSPSFLYLAPYTGVTIAEYFMNKGDDVLVVYDDLSKHAAAYREMSLLLRRPPGREAYPGDVFYLHSRLLERSCRLNSENGGGSITALPIIETQAGDVSTYVPTNVISITDGQIFLESGLFNKGILPAINIGLSVSRVGGAAQQKSVKKNAGKLKLSLAQYRELESFSQFGSDLDESTKRQLERGKRAIEILKQEPFKPVRAAVQSVLLYALNNGFLDSIEISKIPEWQSNVSAFMNADEKTCEMIEKDWNEESESKVKEILSNFADKK
ncbi:MAG: F0F1 ATP synthase subunit alpha [Candidatus Paceibacterota bacterium]